MHSIEFKFTYTPCFALQPQALLLVSDALERIVYG